MEETLIIKNFGPIESVELKLKRFTVLIGEQATGKSTVAKVLAVINSLLDTNPLRKRGLGIMRVSEINSIENFKQHLSVYEIHNYVRPESFIQLTGKVEFRLKEEKITSNLKSFLEKEYNQRNKITYIPADRGATSLFTSATWADLIDVEEGNIDMPRYFLRFFSLYNRLKKDRQFDFSDTLGIKFINRNGSDIVLLKHGSAISIKESASALQTNLPMFVIIDWQTKEKYSNTTFLIEEPELNFFPAMQSVAVKYLIDAALYSDSNFLITTHSPYILTSLNNLLYAYKVGQEHEEEVNAITEKKYWLNPNDVSAYRLFSDGTTKNIMDDDLQQIDAGEIDEVSRTLNSDWDKISNIRFASVDES